MLQILTVIAPLFLIIFVSALLRKLNYIGDNWSIVLNEYAMVIGLPALIFSTLLKAPFSFSEQAPTILVNSLLIIGAFLLALLAGIIFRVNKQMFRTMAACLMFCNIAYLGIPVLERFFGPAILPTASLIVAIYLFWFFTLGIGFLDFTQQHKKKDVVINIIKSLIKNPLLIAVVLGLFVAGLNIKLPGIIMTSMDMVTASVTPTVLIVIGLFIGKSKLGKATEWIPVLIFSLATLFILPAGMYFGLKLFGFSPAQFAPSIIDAAMPVAITPFALADRFGLHKEFIARSIVLSTVLSVITLPFWISILA